jgi:hypothetical protein
MVQCFSDLQQPVNNGAKVQIKIGGRKRGKDEGVQQNPSQDPSQDVVPTELFSFHSFWQGAYAPLL